MAVQRHLTRAPAREALIDIQFEPRLSLEVIDRFVALAEKEFAQKLDLWEGFVGISADGRPPAGRLSVIGRRLDSADKLHVLQCRIGGFTFSRLSPYGSWEELRSRTNSAWRQFREIVDPETITRIAVRCINELKLPLPVPDFSQYLTCPPRVPDPLPQGVSSFLQRVVIPDERYQCTSIVTQALEGPPSISDDGAFITILLDIDVFRQCGLASDREDDLWAGLDVLRDQKNRMFFEHLTEQAVRLFE